MNEKSSLRIRTFMEPCSKQYDISKRVNDFLSDPTIKVITFQSSIMVVEGSSLLSVVLVYEDKYCQEREGIKRLLKALRNYDRLMSVCETSMLKACNIK